MQKSQKSQNVKKVKKSQNKLLHRLIKQYKTVSVTHRQKYCLSTYRDINKKSIQQWNKQRKN